MLTIDPLIATPGPTEIPQRILLAMAKRTTNPDLDPDFFRRYDEARGIIASMVGSSKDNVVVWVGEAMSGLEAAVANLIKAGDKVAVLSNGMFGDAFADLVSPYGGSPIIHRVNYSELLDPDKVRVFLRNEAKEAKVVTMVHCETPSGTLNNLKEIAGVVKSEGRLLIVDAVSSIGGVEVNTAWGIDVLIGGSQKVLNLPSGLTIMVISNEAWDEAERVNYRGFYLNIRLWRNVIEKGEFPYTHSEPLINALLESLRLINEEGFSNVYMRHRAVSRGVVEAVRAMGLKLVPERDEYSSPTVTAFYVPNGLSDVAIREAALKYGALIAGSWGVLKGRVLRIGHMGYTASVNAMVTALTALAKALNDSGYRVKVGDVIEAFLSGVAA
ncbi:pyridoxal-phosphate-dependent aminotransferase family protein [Caldivirga maquilingensis]|uniref:Alanine--glyoxylate transaminase n=1 Tax=Caldivirga maquilingensis (strain ATCC 700844 / DSM 13496 / JCM 10307 / IC-167) TaxID=397948 RepID=A8MAA7_CALMQ|nr:alanine--glyoxylate aminotransferase family protein [Caldivirga maquilingensis]ABW01039.1 Alanine--glyoxylate transaminase [Caldivirga maquilingensis IC-167]